MHFTNFKKPDENQVNVDEEEQTKTIKAFQKPQEENSEEVARSVRRDVSHKLIGKCTNPSRENDIFFRDAINDSNDESVKILGDYLDENGKLQITFGSAGRNAAGCASGHSTIRTNGEAHVIRHELGHTFDSWEGTKMENQPFKRINFESRDYASACYVDDETGKTMNEMLHEELGVSMYKATFKGWKVSYTKQGIDKRQTRIDAVKRVNDIFNKYTDKIFDRQTGVENARLKYKELQLKAKQVDTESWNDIRETDEYKEYERLRQNVYKAENDYRDRIFKTGAMSVSYSNSPEVVETRKLADEARMKYEDKRRKIYREKFGEDNYELYTKLSKAQWGVYKEIEGVAGIVGDTMDYLGASGTQFYQTNGHGSYYFKQRKESGYALEVFANMFDCYMSKDTWKREFVKELFPKSSKIFEKIYYRKWRK